MTYGVTDTVTLMGEVTRTQWNSLRDMSIYFDNPRQQPNPAVEDFGWEDTVFTSIGAEYALNDRGCCAPAYAADQTPTNGATRTPRLPDGDRTWYSIGATWMPSDSWEVSAGYTLISVDDDPTINLEPQVGTSGSSLNGSFSGDANLFGLSAQYRF